jgi:hypothetical protein
MDGDLHAGQRDMLRRIDETDLHPDVPLYPAVVECSYPEAAAWAWAAGVSLRLQGHEIIHDDDTMARELTFDWRCR